nr:MAG TPA: hypothetical protein [Caudoviricetes sp.]
MSAIFMPKNEVKLCVKINMTIWMPTMKNF